MEASPNLLQSLEDWIGENPAAVPQRITEAVMSASGTSSFVGKGSSGTLELKSVLTTKYVSNM